MMNEMEFRLRLIHEEPISATATIKLPKGVSIDGKSRISFPIEAVGVNKPFKKGLEIDASSAKSWQLDGGEVHIKFESRIIRVPLAAVVYDSSLNPRQEEEVVEGFTVHKTTAGDYQMLVSAEHRAGMIRFNQINKESLFLDTFPKVEPFVWWDQFHSGISPFMLGYSSWDWEDAFAKEKWRLRQVTAGPWIGYATKMKSKHIPNAKGVQLEVRYLMLPGTPLANIQVKATNRAKVWRKVMFGIRGALRPDTKKQRIVHTHLDGAPTTYYSTGNGTNIFTSAVDSWGAIEGLSKDKILGVISSERTQPSLTLNIQSENKQTIGIRKWTTLQPGASDMINGYIVLADSKTQVVNLRGLPSRIA
jgi:hypothetical protein